MVPNNYWRTKSKQVGGKKRPPPTAGNTHHQQYYCCTSCIIKNHKFSRCDHVFLLVLDGYGYVTGLLALKIYLIQLSTFKQQRSAEHCATANNKL